jgi:hypothetical protein
MDDVLQRPEFLKPKFPKAYKLGPTNRIMEGKMVPPLKHPPHEIIKAKLGCLKGRKQQRVDHKAHSIQNKDTPVQPYPK